jgi:hypothetical protein
MNNDPVRWQDLTANQRNALVAEHVFGRKVVKWREGRALIMEREGKPGLHESIPAYTESMDEAWKVLQKLQEIHINAHTERGLTVPDVFLSELGFHRVAWFDPNAPVMFTLKDLVAITPETICIVTLRSLGLIIEIEEPTNEQPGQSPAQKTTQSQVADGSTKRTEGTTNEQ